MGAKGVAIPPGHKGYGAIVLTNVKSSDSSSVTASVVGILNSHIRKYENSRITILVNIGKNA